MELTVKDRIVLLGVLPKEGDFKTLKQLRVFKEKLAFSDEEQKDLSFKQQPDGNITWNEPVKGELQSWDIEISDTAMALIVEALKAADKQKRLNVDTFSLYEKFVEPIDEAE